MNIFGKENTISQGRHEIVKRMARDERERANALAKEVGEHLMTIAKQLDRILDLENRVIELEDQRRLNALVAASQTREHLLAEEVISRAEEYFDWLLDDWREDSAVKHFDDKENSADMPDDGVIAGDNPIPGFGPGEITTVEKP